MSWNLVLNMLFAAMLGVGLYYMWCLQSALKNVAHDRLQMEKFIADFSASVARAEKAIVELRATSRDLSLDVDQQMGRAQAMRDELAFLTDTADKIAGRISEASSQAQPASKSARASLRPVPAAPEKFELKLPEMVETPVPLPLPKAEETPVPAWARRAESDVVVINKAPAPLPPKVEPKAEVRPEVRAEAAPEKLARKEAPRSQAERELMQALDKIR